MFDSSVRLAWLVVLGLALGSGVARAQSKADVEARAHFRLARAHYENGAFLKAAEEFEKAYAISERPQLLYNVYLAYRDANVQEEAAEALRSYLEKAEKVPNRPQLEARLAALERGLEKPKQAQADEAKPAGTEPAPSPAETDARVAEAPAAEPAEPVAQGDPEPLALRGDTDRAAGNSKILPIALMAGGGALVAGAVVTGVLAASAQSDLEDGCAVPSACDAELESTRDRGQTLAVVTDVLWITGAVAAGAGLTLFLLRSDDDEHASSRSAPRASVGCAPGGCGGVVEVSF